MWNYDQSRTAVRGADRTRSRRCRAGSRRNKHLHNVGTFGSDRRVGRIDMQALYNAQDVHVVTIPRRHPVDMYAQVQRLIQGGAK